MVTIAQCAFFSPKRSIKVRATCSAPPDSAIILPSMVPSATTSAMCPRVLPTPASYAPTTPDGGMPATSARPMEIRVMTMNGLSR
ncbi:hypothetical protein D3C86_2027710 [compost metagenome]